MTITNPERDSSSSAPSNVEVMDTQLAQVGNFVQEDQDAPDPIQWMVRCFRGQIPKLLITGISLGAVLGLILVALVNPKYESEAIFRIAATKPFIMYQGNSMASRTFDAFVQAQLGMLSGPMLMEDSVEALKVIDPTSDMTPITFRRHLSVSESKSLITINATSNDPETAALLANTLLDTYLQAQRSQARNRGSYRLQELAKREEDLSLRLDQKNDEILALGGEYGVESAIAVHRDNLEVMETSSRRLEEVRRMITELEDYGSSSSTAITDDVLLKELVGDHALDLMLMERSNKLSELAVLELRYQPASKKVIESKAAIAILEKAMADRREQIKALKMSGEIPADAGSRQELIEELQEKLAKQKPQQRILEQEAKQMNAKILRLRSLEKESIMLRELLDETKRALEKVKLESRLDVPGSIELVSRAPLPLEAVQDRRKIFGILGFLTGIFAVIGLFVARNILLPTIRYTDDLECLDQNSPLIGQLKSLDDESISEAADMNMYRLRNSIQLSDIPPLNDKRRAKVIAVVSGSTDVRSSDIASQLASTFSTSTMETLLVETTTEDDTATNGSPGWRDYVAKDDLAVSRDSCGLNVMAIGNQIKGAEEQMSLTQVRGAVNSLSADYDVIVINVGPAAQNIAADFILTQCDIALVVTRPVSPTAGLRRTINHLKSLAPYRVRLVMSEMSAEDPKFSHL